MLSTTNYYKVGGSLKSTHPTYVKRESDRLLIDALKNRDFCYVLNSRQMGKSSLRVQAMKELEKEGLKCASIDVTKIGSNVTQDAWYQGFASELLRGVRLREKVKLNHWWQEHSAATPVQRLGELIEDVLLVEFSQTLVIFVDEIDSMIKLEFKDDFFAFIRACYNQRVDNQDYERLTFCLLGVATVSDLIQDRERTPFNIGKSIELTGFSFHEAKNCLTPGLKNRVENPEQVLAEVLKWTGGQPFLTQKLCQIIVKNNDSRTPDVEELVRTYIVNNNWESHDNPEHLQTIRDRLLVNEKRASRLLGLYQQVLNSIPLPSPLERLEEIPLPSPLERGRQEEDKKPPLSKGGLGGITANNSPEQMELRLTGLVVKRQGELQVANYIYQQVFNLPWVKQELANLRPYSEAFAAWQKSGYQDKSRLLQGKALTDALAWAGDKNLSDRDNKFLSASQESEKQAMVKAQRLLGISLALLFVVAITTGVTVRQTNARLAESEIEAVQKSGTTKLLSDSGKNFDALLEGLRAARQLPKSNLMFQPQVDSKMQVTDALSKAIYTEQTYRERNRLQDHKNSVNSVAFSPDGKTIATASYDNTVKLWNQKGKLLQTLEGHENSVKSVAFSPDGKTIATASYDNTVKLWNQKGKLLQTLVEHENSVNSVAFSPDGEMIAIASYDNTVKLWNQQGKLLQTLVEHEKWVNSVAFSPDRKTIATASSDNTVKLWNQQGKLLQTLEGHENSVNSVAFSPDGKTIASASSDNTVKLWNQQGKLLQTLEGHENSVNSVAFSP
ncbi:MAG: AAA-like domain-containing protein, partial [Cyanobacteriota bacterium]|nr:AAA-like domain-containing protein [Cyanobacteriota bacterium]